MRHVRLAPVLPLLLLAAGCASHRPPPSVAVATPAPAVPVAPPLPEGASAGMMVPQPLADGSFPTPNQRLSEAGTLWHLRAGLNVAALSCPGEAGAAIRAGYNGWLTRQKAPLARVAAAYAAEYRVATPAGRLAYDGAMTRLYNFWSQTPARPGLCAAAAAIVADLAVADSPALATTRLAMLDQPFLDFYRAYDAWRSGRPAQTVIAAAAVVPARAAPAPAGGRSRLVLDLSALPLDTEVAAPSSPPARVASR